MKRRKLQSNLFEMKNTADLKMSDTTVKSEVGAVEEIIEEEAVEKAEPEEVRVIETEPKAEEPEAENPETEESKAEKTEMKVETEEPMLEIKGLSKTFGENQIFKDFSYTFKPGIYAFAGPSGAGKSTLMRMIAGLDTDYTGEIRLNGKVVKSHCPEIHMVHQHYTSYPWMNAVKNVLMVYKGHKIPVTEADIEEAKYILKELGLEAEYEKRPSQISGGQDQRLSIASALINKWSPVVLYDEPTSALDNANDMLIVRKIIEHQAKYNTIEIIITHEQHVLDGLCPEIINLTPAVRGVADS